MSTPLPAGEEHPIGATSPASQTETGNPPSPGLLTNLPAPARWGLLAALSVLASWGLHEAHIPGSLLIGPMLAAILVATNGARLSVPKVPYILSHSMIGCVIAGALDLDTLKTVIGGWPVFLAIVVAVIGASSLLGYLMARSQILPGTTAVWGTSAGAASAMMLMAEAHGADARLVAFMQYLRVVCVASAASLIAAFVFSTPGGAARSVAWFPPLDAVELAKTLAVAFVAAFIGARFKIPAGTMLLPLIATSALHLAGLIIIELPEWLLALAYGIIGWRIGLGFTRRILRHAAHALPQVAGSIAVLMAFCGGLAFLLWWLMDIDPLTAYLATSPGGLDSIAIIAASTDVDISFVMALQTMRLILVLLITPSLTRFVVSRIGQTEPSGL
ncbi:AbrB family transcriptional regulator [Ciceribacter sp. L1K22]|uniref:AbrB family transcriptional regulator n=1 Tax=Ciceribacter sp. L1K22 TaxID=2820275 RepID=UPI001ABE8660|nr:AbrB family transcriptional regulator [Ciceribacter sp. L1K22]MBO3759627.1 AbrB family transcriptional regulator [Ciceribacter sp. L1K22]